MEYHELNDARRKVTYAAVRPYKCDDSIIPGWYRMVEPAGKRIPTTCPGNTMCGTARPGWMNGVHPAVEDGVVSRKVCFSTRNSCCYKSLWIKVRSCGTFYVYYLRGIPNVCPESYCATDWVLSGTPAGTIYPRLSVQPTKSGQGSLWQQSVLRIAAELRYSCQQPLVLELLTMLSIPG